MAHDLTPEDARVVARILRQIQERIDARAGDETPVSVR